MDLTHAAIICDSVEIKGGKKKVDFYVYLWEGQVWKVVPVQYMVV